MMFLGSIKEEPGSKSESFECQDCQPRGVERELSESPDLKKRFLKLDREGSSPARASPIACFQLALQKS